MELLRNQATGPLRREYVALKQAATDEDGPR